LDFQRINKLVLPSTRFPTPTKKTGAGATDCNSIHRRKVRIAGSKVTFWLMVTTLVGLLLCAAHQGGVFNMTNNLLIEFAAHFAITVGSRVDGRTYPNPRDASKPYSFVM